MVEQRDLPKNKIRITEPLAMLIHTGFSSFSFFAAKFFARARLSLLTYSLSSVPPPQLLDTMMGRMNMVAALAAIAVAGLTAPAGEIHICVVLSSYMDVIF